MLGIWYGMQAMAEHFGGRVVRAPVHEFGYARVRVAGAPGQLLDGLADTQMHERSGGTRPPAEIDVWMSHGDSVNVVPEGFRVSASTLSCPVAAISDDSRRFYGLQFHPEVTHTVQGERILRRFVQEIAGCEALWTPEHIIEDAVQRIRDQVGNERVLLGLSGGVDSSVTAALLHKAIGEQLLCVFVDNGLLRLNEADEVLRAFRALPGLQVVHVNAAQTFLMRLRGVSDPEAKRKIIGRTFIEVFNKEAGKPGNIRFLAQGTIYPDVIESAAGKTGKAHVIKSHHNVAGLPEVMSLELVEPLRELFKDEVRRTGLALGLGHEMVYRHPFPGPGLGVRILGEVRKEYADILRRADAIFIEELRREGLYHKVSQAFAVFLPVRSVGVVGDARRYQHVICLRAVETTDFMTAHWTHLPHEFLGRVSSRIINEIPEISRVTYDISGKPPATIEWE